MKWKRTLNILMDQSIVPFSFIESPLKSDMVDLEFMFRIDEVAYSEEKSRDCSTSKSERTTD